MKGFWFKILFAIVGSTPCLVNAAEMSAAENRIPVFVKYRDTAMTRFSLDGANLPAASENPQVLMKSQTASVEAIVFQNLKKEPSLRLQPFWLGGGTFVRLTRSQIQTLRRHELVEFVTQLGRSARLVQVPALVRDHAIDLQPTWYLPNTTYGLEQIRIPELRVRHQGLDGASIKVGVIDTGLDATHPDLAGRVVNYRDWIDPRVTVARDDHGHGTHVAGTIGAADGLRTSIGVAPKIEFISAKAFNRKGDSKDSDLLEALQWMADPDGQAATDDAPKVINNSWEVDGDVTTFDPATDPFCLAIQGLTKLGITTVFAAGNNGRGRNKIKVPGACSEALTVAATDRGDQIASFSSRGPAVWKTEHVAKPDVAAPGKDIESSTPGGGRRSRSGTSMAAPHVTGAVAILLQAKPGLTPLEVKSVLMSTAEDIEAKGFDTDSGAGRIDLVRAVESL